MSSSPSPPSWAQELPRQPLIALLLAGGFEKANPLDHGVLGLLGSDAPAVLALAEQLKTHPQVPVVQLRNRWGNAAYAWADHASAWRSLASLLTEHDLARLQASALDALPRRRDVGSSTGFSDWLLEGLTRSLALLGNSGDCMELSSTTSKGASEWADEIVRQMLTPEGARWGTLSESLPLLAEAAPQAFLDALAQSLRLDVNGVGVLFTKLSPGGNPHGVLRALETLGWDVELMPQVGHSLAALAEFDPEPNRATHPRPLGCLEALLGYALPQTNASAEERLAALTDIARQRPVIGRRLLLRLLPVGMGVLRSSARRPTFLPLTLPPERPPVKHNEAFGQIKTYLDLLVELAGVQAEHWADLVAAAHIPDSLACNLLDRLVAQHKYIEDAQALIWTQLRTILHWLRGAGEPARSRPSFQRRLKLTEEVYRLFAPRDPVVRIAWLFAPRPTPEERFEDFRAQSAYIDDKQQAELRALWQYEDRWRQMERLAQLADSPEPKIIAGWLALALVKSEWSEPMEARLLQGRSFGPFSSIAPQFLALRLHARDFDDTARLIRRLVVENRRDEALSLAFTIPNPWREREGPLWHLLDDVGEPLRESYWHQIRDLWLHDRPQQLQELAVRRLLTFKNIPVALEIVSRGKEVVASPLLLDVLERVALELANTTRSSPIDMDRPFDRHQVTEALSRLEGDPGADSSRARQVELSLLDFLFSGTDHAPAFLIKELSDNPALVAQWASTEEGLGNLRMILHLWRGYPGEDLSRVERAQTLEAWCSAVLRLLSERDTALHIIGIVLARPESDAPDGLWPCLTARRFLDKLIVDPAARARLSLDLRTAKWNSRGMTSRAIGEGGVQEYEIAEKYRHSARRLQSSWPQTAGMLEQLASQYDFDAREHDADAEVDRWRHHMPQHLDDAIMKNAKPLFPLTRVRLENFRAMRELNVELDPNLNVFIGRNASGKTTVLDAIAIGLAEVQDEIFGTKMIDQHLDDRRDRRIAWISATESRQEPALTLQFWGQASDDNSGEIAPHEDTEASAKRDTRSKEALRWIIGRQAGMRRRREAVPENEELAARLWPSKDVLLRREPGPPPVPIFAYYGAKRAVAVEVLKQEPKHAEDAPEGEWNLSRAAAFDGALDAAAGYQALVSWWRSQQTAEDELQKQRQDFAVRLPALQAVRVAVEQAVRASSEGGMRCSNPRTKAGRAGLVVDFDRGDGGAAETLELAQLSDGFRTHLALVMDLARRLVLANPPPDGDINRDRWGTRSYAVVLIDEVELHLHPGWQRSVLQGLRAAFPNTQFIVTTHSPQVLATVPREQVKLLQNCQVVTEGLFVEGRDSNGLLEDIFEVPARPAKMQPRLTELFQLLDDEKYDEARGKLREIEKLLGEHDEAVVKAHWILDMENAESAKHADQQES